MLLSSNLKKYKVIFSKNNINVKNIKNSIHIVDKKVFFLHKKIFKNKNNIILIDANEKNKDFSNISNVIKKIIEYNAKKNTTLIVIGGGIIQDISCFISSVLFRGIKWVYYPTTLLSQADSCIGSKSSINFQFKKNLIGTFNPPDSIYVNFNFLNSLNQKDINSGIGEILKCAIIKNKSKFIKEKDRYIKLILENKEMNNFIIDSLLIKKKIVELDEFDQGPRKIMNYGHTFGHALEAVSKYKIPHGIAITIGMDLANFISKELGFITNIDFNRMHEVLFLNYKNFSKIEIDLSDYFNKLSNDKKNTEKKFFNCVLLKNNNLILKKMPLDHQLKIYIKNFFKIIN
jgi:3-dehydroquinate synthase